MVTRMAFYVGHIDAMKAVLSTFERLPLHFDSGLREQPYEFLIKATCDRLNITRVVLRGFGNSLKDFVKIRATGQIFGELPCGLKNQIDFEGCPKLKTQSVQPMLDTRCKRFFSVENAGKDLCYSIVGLGGTPLGLYGDVGVAPRGAHEVDRELLF